MEPRPDHQCDPWITGVDLNDVDIVEDPLNYLRSWGFGRPGGPPLPQLKSPDEVREEARERSSNIFASFHTLKLIIERHEALLQKRWKKKTQKARLAILLAAWRGPMSATHRPDFEAYRKETNVQRFSGTKYRDAFMWPYINEEDLLKPKHLLLMLNARGRHGPADFAAADYKAMRLGLVSYAIVSIFCNTHVMLFRGRTSPTSYGELMGLGDHPYAFHCIRTQKEHFPGEGLLILEAQERLMSFLLDCAKQLLLDMDEENLLHSSVQPPAPPISESQPGLSSLATMVAEEPYKIPSQLNLDGIKSLLAAKRDEAADHLWSLREDPGYFSFHMYDASEHRQERIKDFKGQLHALFRRNQESIFWGRLLCTETIAAYGQYEIWCELHKLAVRLKSMQSQYSAQIRPNDDLPADYMYALLEFRHWLNQAAKIPIEMLKQGTVASLPWRPYFAREPESDNIYMKDTQLDEHRSHLINLLRTLWEDREQLYFFGMTNLIDELQRLLDGNAKASSMVTSYVAGLIADLSIIAQCLRQIEHYQPWAKSFEILTVHNKANLAASFAQKTQSLGSLIKALEGSNGEVLARRGAPNKIDFSYPVNKRRTKENIDLMRGAESNLDQFWIQFDKIVQSKAKGLAGTAIRALLSGRTLRRTSEWVEPSKREPDKPSLRVDELQKPLSEIYYDLQQRTEQTIVSQSQPAIAKIKKKSRGQAVARPPQESAIQPDAQLTSKSGFEPKPFEVDARALKVFKTLFFTQSATATPGEIPWIDFLHAMALTGFDIRKLQGSMWLFEPKTSYPGSTGVATSAERRKIIFHEPHPVGKIPYMTARRHGRRLNRVYGWHGEMFKLAAHTGKQKIRCAKKALK